ncbi:MAG: transposase [Candidatus Omnitrophota bacterium]
MFNRGNEKKNIFLEMDDYGRFMAKIKEYKIIHEISVICYCLMPNHFHFLLRQDAKDPVSDFIHRLTVSYSMYFNKHYERVGHLFQGSFRAKLIKDENYLLHLSKYIHRNPVEVLSQGEKLAEYPWSSYPEYLKMADMDICDKAIILEQFRGVNTVRAYKDFVEDRLIENKPLQSKDFFAEPE